MPIDPDILPTFLQEARGYVEVLSHREAEMGTLHQSAHSLKGAASMLGLRQIERLARQLEDQLRQGQTGSLPPALAAIEMHLAHLERSGAELPDSDARGGEPDPECGPRAPDRHCAGEPASESAPGAPVERFVLDEDWDPETAALLRDLFADEAMEHLEAITTAVHQLRRAPVDLSPTNEMLRKAHTLKGSASTVGLPRISAAAHLFEERLVALQRAGTLQEGAVSQLHRAVTLLQGMVESARSCDASVQHLADLRSCLEIIDPPAAKAARPVIPSLPVRETRLPAEAQERRWGRIVRPERYILRGPDRRTAVTRRQDDVLRVRVDVGRLDHLMNAVGELVIQRTRIEQRVEELKGLARDMGISRQALHGALAEVDEVDGITRIREVDVEVADAVSNLERAGASLEEDSEALRRTTHTLQESLTQVRMMPIRWLHARLQRPMGELAAAQGKLVELTTDDESTEMDRLVFEQITDPLIHLIRNAVAHGIETPDARTALGKPPVGQIRVNARQKGDLVIVDVEDDGAGMDPSRLRQTLRERGELAESVDRLSDSEVMESIFASGFTTRLQADELAGRGMGLDVVRRNITEMGGDIQLGSTVGQGTRFTIRLPITTAIIQALLFKVGEPVYAIPVGYVVETLVIDAGSDLKAEEETVRARRRWIPLLQLHRVLGGDPPLALQRAQGGEQASGQQMRQPIVVLIYGETQFAVSCTRVVGPREIVLKQLGPLLAGLPLFSSATVSGSSKVQFVLDVAALARMARASKTAPSVTGRRENRNRILVVDDSRSVRAAVSHLLHIAGYSVEVAADGWEAWERLQQQTYDLMITDLEMPRLHGHGLIARCRRFADRRLSDLPILVLTSRTGQSNREMAMARGANGFLAKPINRRLVLEQVKTLIKKGMR